MCGGVLAAGEAAVVGCQRLPVNRVWPSLNQGRSSVSSCQSVAGTADKNMLLEGPQFLHSKTFPTTISILQRGE